MMNYFRLMGLIAQLAQIAESTGGQVPKGDAGLYFLCRAFCERLEERNPGIAEAAGFDYEVLTYRNLVPRPPATFAQVPTAGLLREDDPWS